MSNKKPFNIAAHDQASKTMCDAFVPHIAAMFRAFAAEEDVTRAEAMELTIAYMHTPRSTADGDEGGE